MGAARDKYDQIRIQSPSGNNILPSWRFAVMFIAAVLLGLHVEQVKSDDASPEARIQALERSSKSILKFLIGACITTYGTSYITATPPRLKEAMKQADIILRCSVVDDYILKILSEGQLDKGREFAPFARGNLIMKVQAFPDLRFLCAASLLTIGDLYAMEGNLRMAQSSYLRVANDTSYDMDQYRAR